MYVTTAYESNTVFPMVRFWRYTVFGLALVLSTVGCHWAAQYLRDSARYHGKVQGHCRFFLFILILAGVSITFLFGRRLLNPDGDPMRYWLVWVMMGMACLVAGSVLVSLQSRQHLVAALLSLAFAAPTLVLLRKTGGLPSVGSAKGMIVAGVAMLPLIYGLALLAAHVVARRWRSGWAQDEHAGEHAPAAWWPFVLTGIVGLIAALMPFVLLLYRAADYQMPDSYIWIVSGLRSVAGGSVSTVLAC